MDYPSVELSECMRRWLRCGIDAALLVEKTLWQQVVVDYEQGMMIVVPSGASSSKDSVLQTRHCHWWNMISLRPALYRRDDIIYLIILHTR
jgi:hypothetical protein